jgi:hypothetical protein
MRTFDSYLIQKFFNPNGPPSNLGQYVNIVHVSMLYWPSPVKPKVISRRPQSQVKEPITPPPVHAGRSPHGEYREINPGIRISGI